MQPAPPPGPPDIEEQRTLIDQWVAFADGLAQGYTFDLDNWLNDVDIRQLIREAEPMFGPDELADYAVRLEEADRVFRQATRDLDKCVWGKKAARREKWTAAKNWWYFRAPRRSNAQLEEELAKLK
jgi:hypothetical protein